jgi:hypothetical protein
MLTPKQAYDLASQWGSYMRAGDPGACFYGFHVDDGRPVREAHRRQCLAYGLQLMQTCRPHEFAELRRLREFFATTELRP